MDEAEQWVENFGSVLVERGEVAGQKLKEVKVELRKKLSEGPRTFWERAEEK